MLRIGVIFLVLAAAVWTVSREARRPPGRAIAQPVGAQGGDFNVALISLDTLRADHLGCYGYHRPTSPNLDRLAAASILYEHAYSAAPATAESHMSLFTGVYPSVHKVWTVTDRKAASALPRKLRTLPEILRRHGYATAGFHEGGHVDEIYGFGRGFDVYESRTEGKAEEWLRENAGKRKFFLFYHTYWVHDPYTPRPPYDTMFDPDYDGGIIHDRDLLRTLGNGNAHAEFWRRVNKNDPRDRAHLVALYDGLIAELDHHLGRLFSLIDEFAPNTILIVTSDHGEEFGEHGGFRHGRLFHEILHIPLIIRHPRGPRGVRVSEPVSLINMAPAILEMLALPAAPQFQGRVPVSVANQPPLFAEFPSAMEASAIANGRQLIKRGVGDLYFAWGERASRPARGRLERALEIFQSANAVKELLYDADALREMDPRTIERLRSLGYIR